MWTAPHFFSHGPRTYPPADLTLPFRVQLGTLQFLLSFFLVLRPNSVVLGDHARGTECGAGMGPATAVSLLCGPQLSWSQSREPHTDSQVALYPYRCAQHPQDPKSHSALQISQSAGIRATSVDRVGWGRALSTPKHCRAVVRTKVGVTGSPLAMPPWPCPLPQTLLLEPHAEPTPSLGVCGCSAGTETVPLRTLQYF